VIGLTDLSCPSNGAGGARGSYSSATIAAIAHMAAAGQYNMRRYFRIIKCGALAAMDHEPE